MAYYYDVGHDVEGRYLGGSYRVTCWVNDPLGGETVILERDGTCTGCGRLLEKLDVDREDAK